MKNKAGPIEVACGTWKKIFFFLILLCSGPLFSQNPHVFFYENEFGFSIPTETPWTFGLEFGNRGQLAERLDGRKTSGYQHDHVEITQYTGYQTTEAIFLSLGFRYRWREMFDDSEHNEFRIIEQFEYEHPESFIGLAHRFRSEQRFREATIFRFRYELEVEKSVSEDFSVGASTEALYAISSQLKPEAEQRFTLKFGNTSFDNLELQLSFEYRMENYNIQLENEYFVITEVDWEL